MNFLLETLAFLQLAFLPGALLLRVSKLKLGPLGSIVACLAASGLLNYLFVLLAVACGVFTHGTAFGFVALELLLAVWLWRGELLRILRLDVLKASSDLASKALKALSRFVETADCPKAFAFLSLLAAFAAFIIAAQSFLGATGTIFDAWDAVLSWNRWATGWLAGSYPEWTNGYPQLVPTNWALAYMIQGDVLQFVPKMTVGLYELGVLLALIDLAFVYRSAGLMMAAPFFAWLLRNVEIARFGGDVDLAVTFMSFATFHCLARAAKAQDSALFKRLLFTVSVFAAATAATKQAGLFIFVMILPIGYLLLREPLRRFGLGAGYKLKALGTHLLLAALIAAPCYIAAKYMVMQGRDKYKVKFVTEDIYGGRGYAERAIISSKMFLLRLELGMHEVPGARWCRVAMDRGLDGFQDFFKPYRALTLAAAIATSVLLLLAASSSPLALWTLLFAALPLTVIWALLYCYDLRNLTSALPFLALGLGVGLERLASLCGPKLPPLRLGWLFAALLALLAALGLTVLDKAALSSAHETLEMRIGDARLNAKIYAYKEKHPIEGRIATDYEFVSYMPGLKGSLCYQEFSGQGQKELNLYLMAMEDPSVGFLLVPSYAMKAIWDDIQRRVDAGELERLFNEYNYTFIKINRRPAPQQPPATTDGSPAK